MNQKKFLFVAIAFKVSFLALTISVVIFPRFVWRTDSTSTTVRQAITNKENLETFDPDRGFTPLIGASEIGDVESVKLLLEHGVNPDIHARNPIDSSTLEAGSTALHYACLNAHVPIVKLLVEYKANVASTNKNGDSPVFVLISNGATRLEDKNACMHILFGNNDKTRRLLLNQQNKDGFTPLMAAIESRSESAVRFLLDAGKNQINFGLKNKYGERTLDVATREAGRTGWRPGQIDDTITGLVRAAHDKWERTQQ